MTSVERIAGELRRDKPADYEEVRVAHREPEGYRPPRDPDAGLIYDRVMDRICIDGITFTGEFFRSLRKGKFVMSVDRERSILGTQTIDAFVESPNRFKRAWQAFWR